MTYLSEEALASFRTHHGMSTGVMLAAAGLSRRARAAAVEDGVLEVLHERVLHIMSSPMTLEARCVALCLGYPQGFVTGSTAGKLLGLRRMPNSDVVQFCVPHGAHVGPFDGVRLRQSTKIEPAHIIRRGDGIRIASGARLAFDLAGELSALDHRSVVEQLLRDGRCTMATLGRMGATMAHPARAGSARFVATLLGRSGRPADSHPELLLAERLRARGVPVEAQVHPLLVAGSRPIRLDLAVPSVKWGIEVDVHPDHLLLDGTTRDKRRDRASHRVGWQIERVTELDLFDLDGICDELVELYEIRCQALAA